MTKLVGLIYPFTKAKLHRAANFLGTLLAASAVIAVWLSSIDAGEKIGATIVLLTTFLTNARKAITKLDAAVDSLPIPADDEPTKPLPRPSPNTPVICALILGSLLLSGQALAQAKAPQALGCLDSSNTYCVVPAAAVGAQLNLKDWTVKNGVVLLGAELQHTFGSLPMGAGAFVGLGASSDNQRSYQACLGLSITNWGLFCAGAQRATFSDGHSAWQGMLTVAGKLTFGGTPSYVRESR